MKHPRALCICESCGEERPHYTAISHGVPFVRKRCVECRSADRRAMPRSWKVWNAMRRRAGVAQHYEHVTVCARWRSYEAFLADMGEPPPGRSIDRIDGAKGYEPGNCRWATIEEQNRNRDIVRPLTHGGRTLTIPEWASETGIKIVTIRARLRSGWTVDATLSTPTGAIKRNRSPDPCAMRAVLAIVAEHPDGICGADVVRASRGTVRPKGVHGTLQKLEAKGMLASRLEPRRDGVPRRLYVRTEAPASGALAPIPDEQEGPDA